MNGLMSGSCTASELHEVVEDLLVRALDEEGVQGEVRIAPLLLLLHITHYTDCPLEPMATVHHTL